MFDPSTIHHRHTRGSHLTRRFWRAVFLIAAVMLLAPATTAANSVSSDIEARYQSELAGCSKVLSSESRAACEREAAAAKEAAKRGLLEAPQTTFEKNALARCEALPAADRDHCERRVQGEGETSGSVSGGGIYREYREITLPSVNQEK